MAVTKRGKIYEVRCRYQDKALRRRFSCKWQAQDFESAIAKGKSPEEAQLLALRASIRDTGGVNLPTFREFVERRFIPGQKDGRATSTETPNQAGTVQRLHNQLKIAYPFIGNKRLDSLTYQDYREVKWQLANAPLNNGRPYKTSTANKTLSAMKQVLTYAVREDVIASNRWMGAREIPLTRADKPHWKLDEGVKFLEAVKAEREDLFVYFLIALQSGLRRSELFGLRKMDVDVKDKVIRVCRQWDTDAYEFPADGIRRIAFKSKLKNGEPSKLIPMTDTLCVVLERYMTRLIRPETPLVSLPVKYMKNMRKYVIKPFAEKAGVPGYKLHATRDSFIGNMKRAGISDFHIAKIAGCRVRNLERYGDLDMDDVAKAVTAVEMTSLI